MNKCFFYGTDAQIAAGSANFSTRITATPTVFGLVAGQATAYAAMNTAFQAAYTAAITPATRTKSAVAFKNLARTNLRTMASDLAKIIDGTPTVTDSQKIDLGLSVRKTPTPVPAPTVRPGMDLVSVAGRTVTVHVHDTASSTKRGKPAGATQSFLYTYVGANYPVDPTLWQFQGAYTKANCEIVFAESVAGGAQVWVCAAWVNRRGEAGPVSVPITTNIQGGGVSTTSTMKIAA